MISYTEISSIVEQMQFADRFTATIASPNLSKVKFNIEDSIRIKSVNIPNHTIETKDVNYGGRSLKIATNKTYDSIVVTFYDSEYAKLRHTFDNWMHAIFDRSSNRLAFYDTYIAQSLVIELHRTENEMAFGKIEFTEVYPTQIDDITYDRTSSDTWIEFKVSFAFKSLIFHDGSSLDSTNNTDVEQYRINAIVDSGGTVATDEDEMAAAQARQAAAQGW